MDPFPANTVSDEADGFPEADQQDQDDSRLDPLSKKRKKNQPESPVAKRSCEHWDSSSSEPESENLAVGPEDSPVANPSFADWDSTPPEAELEDFYMPNRLFVWNLHTETSKRDIEEFFNYKTVEILIDDEEYRGQMKKTAEICFGCLQDTKEAYKKKGESLRDLRVLIKLLPNKRIVLSVSGYDHNLSEELIKEQLKTFFESCGVVKKIFIPKDRDTGGCLSFGYIYMRQIDNKAEEKDSESMGGRVIKVTDVTSNVRFRDIKAEMEADGWESSEESEDGDEDGAEDGVFEDSEDDDSEEREPEGGEEREPEDGEEGEAEGD